jgi:bacterioferritin-associated ferredoxin
MIICICHNVSDKKIRAIMATHGDEIHHLKDLKKHIPICNQCGKCKDEIKQLIKHEIKEHIEVKKD